MEGCLKYVITRGSQVWRYQDNILVFLLDGDRFYITEKNTMVSIKTPPIWGPIEALEGLLP